MSLERVEAESRLFDFANTDILENLLLQLQSDTKRDLAKVVHIQTN